MRGRSTRIMCIVCHEVVDTKKEMPRAVCRKGKAPRTRFSGVGFIALLQVYSCCGSASSGGGTLEILRV